MSSVDKIMRLNSSGASDPKLTIVTFANGQIEKEKKGLASVDNDHVSTDRRERKKKRGKCNVISLKRTVSRAFDKERAFPIVGQQFSNFQNHRDDSITVFRTRAKNYFSTTTTTMTTATTMSKKSTKRGVTCCLVRFILSR